MAKVVGTCLYALLLLATTLSYAFYVGVGDKIYYFSETKIKVNEKYRDVCDHLPFDAWPVSVRSKKEQLFLFKAYSGNESYLVGQFGPGENSRFFSYTHAYRS